MNAANAVLAVAIVLLGVGAPVIAASFNLLDSEVTGDLTSDRSGYLSRELNLFGGSAIEGSFSADGTSKMVLYILTEAEFRGWSRGVSPRAPLFARWSASASFSYSFNSTGKHFLVLAYASSSSSTIRQATLSFHVSGLDYQLAGIGGAIVTLGTLMVVWWRRQRHLVPVIIGFKPRPPRPAPGTVHVPTGVVFFE